MKNLLLILIVIPSLSYSADIVKLLGKPKVLELSKYRTVSGNLEIHYIHENPRVNMKLSTGSKEVNDFLIKFKNSDITKLNCDGDFAPFFDNSNTQFIQINSLKACIDEENSVIAHSIGINKLSDKDLEASKKFIEENLKPVLALNEPNIKNDNKPKIIDNPKEGTFSPKLESKTANK